MKNKFVSYDKKYNNINKIINKIEKDINILNNNLNNLKEITNYYESKEWLNDFENYKDQNIAVLSEDGIWNMLEKLNDLSIELTKINKIINKNKTKL